MPPNPVRRWVSKVPLPRKAKGHSTDSVRPTGTVVAAVVVAASSANSVIFNPPARQALPVLPKEVSQPRQAKVRNLKAAAAMDSPRPHANSAGSPAVAGVVRAKAPRSVPPRHRLLSPAQRRR